MHISTLIEILQLEANPELNQDIFLENIYIDTRHISQSNQSIFCAIIGEKRDGHNFIQAAYQKGIRLFLISNDIDLEKYPDASFLKVTNTLDALQRIAKYNRSLFHNDVIGITGSNGKTIVKEWLSGILSHIPEFMQNAGIIKSPKSYNSQIGVPLSVWKIQKDHTLGIFEAGISKVGEMEILETIIQPSIGILTNIGDAHGEFFKNQEEKLQEKLKLFTHSKVLIYNSDKEIVNTHIEWLKTSNPQLQLLSWSNNNPNAYVYIKEKKLSRNACSIVISHNGICHNIQIPFTQEAYIKNAILVITVLLYLHVNIEAIKQGISQLKAVAMRLEVRDAINRSSIISDTYNSDITSLKVAVEYLAQQYGDKKSIILSDIKESGLSAEENVRHIIQLLQNYKLIRFIGIGNQLKENEQYISDHLSIPCYFFSSTDEFLKEFPPSHFQNETILIKGARSFEFERIQHRLELSIHQTVMEVNLDALEHNFNQFKKCLSPDTKTMAMVKAFSYGHGGLEVAQKLQFSGVNYLAVAYADEGIELRNGGVSLPIMVMSPEISGFESMIRWKLEPEIFNIYSLKLFSESAVKHQESEYPIHIKLDTGMHRLGFMEDEIDDLIDYVRNNSSIKIASIFTHLAGSDSPIFNDYTKLQHEKFERMSTKIISALDYTPLRHVSNTAAIVNHHSLEYDMVRIGIGMYGINHINSPKLHLQNVATLKTYIVQIRQLESGETIGYNRRGKLMRKSKIATVAIGYADGYLRQYANANAFMLINGHKAPIIGSICMDMCMLDVTDIPDVQEGDEVIVFGEDLPVETLAEWAGTISYEVLTHISNRVKRVHIND